MCWPLLWAVLLATNAQQEDETRFRKLEEPRLEKDVQLFTSLIPLEIAEQVREQDKKVETLVYHFAKLGGCKLSWIIGILRDVISEKSEKRRML